MREYGRHRYHAAADVALVQEQRSLMSVARGRVAGAESSEFLALCWEAARAVSRRFCFSLSLSSSSLCRAL